MVRVKTSRVQSSGMILYCLINEKVRETSVVDIFSSELSIKGRFQVMRKYPCLLEGADLPDLDCLTLSEPSEGGRQCV